jgi:hypothetical protein
MRYGLGISVCHRSEVAKEEHILWSIANQEQALRLAKS